MTEEDISYAEDIQTALKAAGTEADLETCEKLSVYMKGVLEKNLYINLTRVTEPEAFIKEHIVDSASLTRLDAYKEAKKICDLGTGAGFPGIVLAALSPDKQIVMVDSVKKKLKVILMMSERAGIKNIQLVHERAEDIGHNKAFREKFDLVTARAVARLSTLAEYCIPLVKIGGTFAAFKGEACSEEAEEAANAAKILGAPGIDILDAGVSGTNHVFAVMKKTGKTPGQYPRRPGEPTRNPL